MNLLIALLFTKGISAKKVNPKQTSRKIKKEVKFWIQLITELVQLTNIIFKFVFVSIGTIYKKCVCQSRVVEEEKLPSNVIKFDEYKLKKAK